MKQPKPTILESIASHVVDKRIWLFAERILEEAEDRLFTSKMANQFRDDAIQSFIDDFEDPTPSEQEQLGDQLVNSEYATADAVYVRITVTSKEFYLISRYQGPLGRGVLAIWQAKYCQNPTYYVCIKESEKSFRVYWVDENYEVLTSDPLGFPTFYPNGILYKYEGQR